MPRSKTIWRTIKGAKNYQVSNTGRVRSKDRIITFSTGAKRFYLGKELKPLFAQGYLRVSITPDVGRSGKRVYLVHQLVILAFGPPKPQLNGQVDTRHKDGNTRNNHISNLAWSSPWRNSQDRYKHDTVPYGERANRKVLSEKIAKRAIKLRKKGWTYKAIAEKLGHKQGTIADVCLGRTWPHLER